MAIKLDLFCPSQGQGYITTDVLKEILVELDPKLTPTDLDGIIEEVDEDGSGTLDFDGEWEESQQREKKKRGKKNKKMRKKRERGGVERVREG